MLFFRIGFAALSTLFLAACSTAETSPPPVAAEPVAEPAVERLAPEPDPAPSEREPSLQERWRSPFGVVSRGRAASREPRQVVVLAPEAAPAASSPAVQTAAVSRPASTASAGPVPAPAEPRPAAASRPASSADTRGARTHKVEWGETWYGIARRYQVAPAALGAANPEVDPEKLRSGQVLRVPSGSAAAPAQRSHTVAAGETLWGIARRYGVTMEQIRKANSLKDDKVRLGQTLIIPRTEESR